MTLKNRKSSRSAASPDEERLDATPERLARAKEAGQKAEKDVDRLRRILDPFDVMRSTRALAPHDPKLNDVRWLIGEALRRIYQRARLDNLRAVQPETLGVTGFGPAPDCLPAKSRFNARDKLRPRKEGWAPPLGRS